MLKSTAVHNTVSKSMIEMLVYKSESWTNDEMQNKKSWCVETIADCSRRPAVWPQTANARRPKSLGYVFVGWRLHGSMPSEEIADVGPTRSATYDGQRWVVTWCTNAATLNWMRYFTGSQSSTAVHIFTNIFMCIFFVHRLTSWRSGVQCLPLLVKTVIALPV